jgi:HEAT repeat protein
MSNDRSQPDGVTAIDSLIERAGRTHVIPHREDQSLLDLLREPRVFRRATELLRSKNKEERHRSILCLERIGYVLKDQQTAEVLLQHADRTKDKLEVMTTLDALKNCTPPQPLAAEPLVRLARRPEWQAWHAAVQCLHLAPAGEVEHALLERLDSDADGLVYVARELRFMSSTQSIKALEDLLGSSTLDVRCVALDSLGERLGAGVLPFARRFATGLFQDQWWAAKWIARFGTSEDVPFFAKRAKTLTTGGRRTIEPPEVATLVPFLSRHSEQPDARRALDLLGSRADRLPDNERRWLELHARDLLRSS